MGSLLSRQRDGRVEEVDMNSCNAYCYPPKTSNYFATHFIMGGERFDTCQPECYLFGENMDLNFLGSRPTPFPYTAPLPHEPTRTLRALINIRKESLRFQRVGQSVGQQVGQHVETQLKSPLVDVTEQQNKFLYNIEFTFDSDVKCSVVIHYFCSEELTPNAMIYTSKHMISSETYFYKKGSNQQFSQTSHSFDPSMFSEEELSYRSVDDRGEFDSSALFPVVIQMSAQEGDEPRQSHSLIAVVERNHENTYSIKPLKQKIFVDGLCYLLQEIYGIENKNAISSKADTFKSKDEDLEDNSSECVICMSDTRDTLILPCRHLCLCNGCADSLRYQANNCPICRAPFRALLQLKAVRKTTLSNTPLVSSSPSVTHQLMPSNSSSDLVDIPPGYEAISLIEALNGPICQSSNGMFAYRSIANEINETSISKKYHKNEHRSKKVNALNMGSDTNSDSMCGAINSPNQYSTQCTRLVASPSTPEVIVSGMPLSPIKDNCDNVEVDISKSTDCEPDVRQIWNVDIVSNADDNDNGSASSSSSATAENIAIQERVRLLSNDKDVDDDIDYMIDDREDKNIDEDGEIHAFRIAETLNKDLPGNASPLSIGISSASYAIKSLRDGLEEQRTMDADLVSIATNGSTNDILLAAMAHHNHDDGDNESDYFTSNPTSHQHSNLHFDDELHKYNKCLDEDNDNSRVAQKANEKCLKEKLSFAMKQPVGRIKLAETEILDDSDLSPSEV